MIMQWSNCGGQYEDSSVSTIVGKTKSAVIPGTSRPEIRGWYVSLISASQNKEAAWTVIEYMTDKEHSKKYAVMPQTRWMSGRKSLAMDPEVLEAAPEYATILHSR